MDKSEGIEHSFNTPDGFQFHCFFSVLEFLGGNKSTGVQVAFNRRYLNLSNVVALSFPVDISLQGRAGAVRAASGRAVICIVS